MANQYDHIPNQRTHMVAKNVQNALTRINEWNKRLHILEAAGYDTSINDDGTINAIKKTDDN